MKIRMTAAAVLLGGALALAGCSATSGGDHSNMPGMESTPPAEATQANDADVMFASMMIVHHEQAVEMSDLMLAKDGIDPQVTDLAERIKAAQAPEIAQLRDWLEDWGAEPAPGGMDHGDGMMSSADLAALDEATGADAARLFLEQMIVHHDGAIAMAETQVADGENADALALAQAVIDAQTAEVAEMQDLLGAL